jgi:hypothetical protein
VKCWTSAFSAQGLRLIIAVVQVGAAKLYVTAVEAPGKRERGDETQFTTNIGGKTSLGPSLVKFHSQLRIWWHIVPKLAVLAALTPDFTDNFNISTLYRFIISICEISWRKWPWFHSIFINPLHIFAYRQRWENADKMSK